MYERYKGRHVSNGPLYYVEQSLAQGADGPVSTDRTVLKTPEQYGLEQAVTRGAMDFCHELNNFRNKLIESLKKEEDE